MSKTTAGCWVLVTLLPAAMWSAYVATRLWTWFAVPLGAPHLTVARAMGLSLIVGMYRYSGSTSDAEKDVESKTGGQIIGGWLGKAALIPALVLLFGWIYQQFL